MKLAKISLATLVALGAFSSVASATPLEEAIKNVDLSGFARYRYDNKSGKAKENGKTEKLEHKGAHRFTVKTNFKAALDDNFFGVVGMRYNVKDGSYSSNARANTTSTLQLSELYLGYKRGGTTVLLGKQNVGAYFTDDLIGVGAKVLNQDIPGLTLAAVAFDSLEGAVGNGWGPTNEVGKEDPKADNSGLLNAVLSENLYGVAAIGSYDPVNFQLWYAKLTGIADLIAVDVATKFGVAEGVDLGLQVQFGHSDMGKKAKELGLKDTNFYATEASAELFGADLALGYIGWKVQEKGAGFVTVDDQGKFIDVGQQTFDYTALEGKGNFFFGKVGYKLDKVMLGAELIKGSVKDAAGEKTKGLEAVARLGYDYSKKLKFSTFYSHLKTKEDGSKEKSNQFRFETK